MVKNGTFVCPVPNCNKQFYITSYFVKHLQLEANIEPELFQKINTVECPYCTQTFEYMHLRQHFQNNHRDVSINCFL